MIKVMWGALLFLVSFLFIAPASRDMIFAMLSHAKDWITAWQPFSYIVVLLIVVAPLAAFQLMTHWPGVPEPEDPMAKYRHAEENPDLD